MLEQLKDNLNIGYTQNGARVYATTGNAVLDFFSKSGAMRQMSDQEKISLFTKAFSENPLLALKALFYMRDVRGGLGERNSFRAIIRYMADYHTGKMQNNIHLVPFFGRWDDLLVFIGTRLEIAALNIISAQFLSDLYAESPSLLAKWLPSENASSYKTKILGKRVREHLGLTPRLYRKHLSSLRARINVLERDMSANNWYDIDYSKIPSQAGMRYRNAFFRHDEAGYSQFLESIKHGDVKVNTSTLYPYEVIRDLFTGGMDLYGNKYNVGTRTLSPNNEDAINTMWANLPDYFGGNQDNSLVVADTSGSMRGLPIQIAISLAIYAAERNKGKFKNHFMTFSGNPVLVELQGTSVCEKVRNMAKANWDSNTNIEKVFRVILETALKNSVPADEMIDRVVIISDMQFDQSADGGNNKSLFQTFKDRYEFAGYQLPRIVFWNVNAYAGNTPAKLTDTGVQLVSGASASLFTNIIKGKLLTAYDLMINTLESDRYSVVSI